MVIAIDGPAGSGKSTIAKMLSQKFRLGGERRFTYINSGNLYRAVTLAAGRRGVDEHDGGALVALAKEIRLECSGESVFLDGEDVTPLLHSDVIDRFVSQVSANVPVRHIINDMIKKMADGRDIVVEGRDMTTVVFPDAEARFYLDASAESRARRRFEQGVSKLSLSEIKKTILERDEMDRHKTEGSLKIDPSARYIDTSPLTITQVYERLEEIIRLKG
jgi:cytidylate kinase